MFFCCGDSDVVYSEQLPSTPTDQECLEEVCQLRQLLSTDGVIVRRINTSREVVEKKVVLLADGSGLEYTPCSKKREYILFADLCDVSIEDSNTKTYRKSNLNASQDVIINFRTSSGQVWRLVYNSRSEAERWLWFIGYERSSTYNSKGTEDTLEGRVLALFRGADSDHNGQLTLKEAKKLMVHLNVNMSDTTLKTIFKEFDSSGDGNLDIDEFSELFRILTDRPELRAIFDRFASSPEKGMSLNDFRNFCVYQQESESYGALVFSTLSPNNDGYIAFQSFVNYLLGTNLNHWMDLKNKVGVVDSMTFSLKDYFIKSSHNTYLSGNQLSSGSTVDMYKKALLAGCRCVELDCWDGPKKVPVIYHGHTRTSKILFSDALESIHRYAFAVSPYPVILSLEVHTSPNQSDVLAATLKKVFGSLLLMWSEVPTHAYTPDSLKHRIIVKWKSAEVDDNGSVISNESCEANVGKRLATYVGMSACSTADWGASAKPYNVKSYSETKVETLAEENKDNFILQNSRMISRVYPKGTRITSSNYNPTESWAVGCQLVALNYQTWDEPMRINDAMFAKNGRCGYVLKPLFLREPSKGSPTPYSLKITVVCGAQIPKPNFEKKGDIVDPYVELLINGTLIERTSTVMNNGLKPYWGEEFVLRGSCLELDILSLRVVDQDSTSADDEVCECCVPLCCLQHGYRAFPLKLCANGVRVQCASLLCHVELKASDKK